MYTYYTKDRACLINLHLMHFLFICLLKGSLKPTIISHAFMLKNLGKFEYDLCEQNNLQQVNFKVEAIVRGNCKSSNFRRKSQTNLVIGNLTPASRKSGFPTTCFISGQKGIFNVIVYIDMHILKVWLNNYWNNWKLNNNIILSFKISVLNETVIKMPWNKLYLVTSCWRASILVMRNVKRKLLTQCARLFMLVQKIRRRL